MFNCEKAKDTRGCLIRVSPAVVTAEPERKSGETGFDSRSEAEIRLLADGRCHSHKAL